MVSYYFSILGRHYKVSEDGEHIYTNPFTPLEVFPVTEGDKYYFRVICSSLTFPFSISIDGHPLHVVASDGHDFVTEVVDFLVVNSGERYDFWIDATNPGGLGNFWIHAETLEVELQGSVRPIKIMTSSNGNISALLALCVVNPLVNSPHKGKWRRAFMFSLICASINGRVNNREAGDLRRHRAYYDVTVMKPTVAKPNLSSMFIATTVLLNIILRNITNICEFSIISNPWKCRQ